MYDRINLCTYFLLPLTGVNKSSFGEYRFRQCWLSKEQMTLTVSTSSGTIKAMGEEPKKNVLFDHSYAAIESDYFVYRIPAQFYKEVDYFLSGKYSKFSEAAISIIEQKSTLKFNFIVPGDDAIITDRKLLALRKSQTLKESLEADIGSKLPNDAELLDIPNLEAELLS